MHNRLRTILSASSIRKINDMLSRYQNIASLRNIEFDLDFDVIADLISGCCGCCGEDLGSDVALTISCINLTHGYKIGNVVAFHRACKKKLNKKKSLQGLDRYRQSPRYKDTKPELKTEGWLTACGIKFNKQLRIKGVSVDFYLPDLNACCFVDGFYWHGHDCLSQPFNGRQIATKKRDSLNTRKLKTAGYSVVRIWECDINKGQFPQLAKPILAV